MSMLALYEMQSRTAATSPSWAAGTSSSVAFAYVTGKKKKKVERAEGKIQEALDTTHSLHLVVLTRVAIAAATTARTQAYAS